MTRIAILLLSVLACPALAQDLFEIIASNPLDMLGDTVARAGDVDGDGVPDIAVGAWLADANGNNSGTVTVYSGATQAVLLTAHGNPEEAYGTAAASAGDWNGDGFDDIAVGGPWFSGPAGESGRAQVLSGADAAVLFEVSGGGLGTPVFGASVSLAGDVDADGVLDLVVGATNDHGGGTNTGAARVYSGASGVELYAWFGQASNSQEGSAVAAAGDVDGDGFDDVVVGSVNGASGVTKPGRVTLRSGADGSIIHVWNGNQGDRLGVDVDGGSDLDGDGVPDIVAGASMADGNGFTLNTGEVIAWSGASGNVLQRWKGAGNGDDFGGEVVLAGDVDGDGRGDVLVGALGAPNGGCAYAFSGSDGALLTARTGTPLTLFGRGVSAVGDLDGDGLPDLLAGASSGPGNLGRVRAFTGLGGSINSYGEGCVGSNGKSPLLALFGSTFVGDEHVLTLTRAPASSSLAMLFLGLDAVSLPVAGGCELLVDPVLVALPLPLSDGQLTLSGELPPAAAGAGSIVLQVFVQDLGLPTGFTTSNGVELVFP